MRLALKPVHGDALTAELLAAGVEAEVSIVGDYLMIETDAPEAQVRPVVDAHVPPPPPEPVPTLAELAAEVRGMKRAAAAEAAKATPTAKGVAAAIAADNA